MRLRRLLSVLLSLCLCLSLPSCAETRMSQEELLLTFRCRASVAYAGETYDCRIERQGPGVVTVRTPSVGYHWQGEFFSQTSAGLESVSETCPLPESCFAVWLVRFLDAMQRSGALTAVSPSSFEGSVEGRAFTVTADPSDGRLETLTVPQLGLSVTFYEYDP